MFAHTAEARAAQGAHPHHFCGSSLPGHSRVLAPSLRERGRKTVLALSPINTQKGTSSGSQELLPEAHYRELTGFKKRKRRGRSQILWDCLESAESKGKHRPLRRALALGSKQPGFPPCRWCSVACGSPSLLIIIKGDFSLASVLWRLDVTYAEHQAQVCSRPTGISTAVRIAFLVIFIFTTVFPWRFGFVFHFLTLKMSTFQAVMLPADILKINVLLTSFWFFIVYRALSHCKGGWGAGLSSPGEETQTGRAVGYSQSHLASKWQTWPQGSFDDLKPLFQHAGARPDPLLRICSFPCSCQYQQVCRELSHPDLCWLCREKARGEADEEKVDRR